VEPTEDLSPEQARVQRERAMGRKAARGSKWALIANLGGQAMRLGGNLILTRLIAREAFGVMLIVNTVLQGINLFSDVGIGPAIIQNKRDDAPFLNTAWTIQAARGLALTLIATALAWPIAVGYGQPVLAGLIPFVGLSAVINGLRSTKMFTANRKLAIGRISFVEFSSKAMGLAATLVWAILDPSVWALAAGAVAAALTMTSLSHGILQGLRNRLTWDRDAAKALFKFGKWVFVSTLLGYLAMQSDRLIFGKLVPIDELGVYAIATLIATAPQMALRHMTLTVNFPLYSQTVRDQGDLPSVFRRGRTRVLMLGGFVAAAMIAGGPTAIDILYEDQYRDAGWMVQLLAVSTWFNVLEVTVESALLARGETRRVALANAGKVILMIATMLAGWAVAGFPGAIAGFSVAELFRYAFMGLAARRANLGGINQEIGYTLLVAASGLAGYGGVLALRTIDAHVLIEAIAVAGIVGLGWAPLLLLALRRRQRERKG
jgi:O-antigen/teichoic acid export membrane protein